MKKLILKISTITLALGAFVFSSCSSDDDAPTPPSAETTADKLKKGEMNGELEENFTLDASTTYELTGKFIVKEGTKLTIPAGTNILVKASGTESYIAVLKGAQIDIQGTAASPVVMSSEKGNPGDWGGLTICGNATTTAGVDAVAEVGGFIYGGTNDTDNSGSIKYLVIRGTGAQINPDAQYNGVSFYAVGSGTVVENIAVINGADDGVEFFGGTVSAKKLYLENNQDDSIDWTEGWNGTIDDAYVAHTNDGFSTVVEADGENKNPKINNLTAVNTFQATGGSGTALQFKKQSGATITGLSLVGYKTSVDMKDGGALTNVNLNGATADPANAYDLAATVDITGWTWIGAQLSLTGKLGGSLTSDLTLDASVAYELESFLLVQDGVTLTIPAGTKITARAGGVSVYIAVLKGGKIDIQGTAANPVVMSSKDGNPGDWGGLTICGKATTTAGVDAVAEVGGFIYGGTNDADNSGSVKYLVIKGTGAQINPDSQYNGVSFYAVGSGTVVENIAVVDGADDGVEFFGGTVSATNLYLENNADDAVDWTEGWNGTVTNTYVSHTIAGFSTALEADGANENPKLVNFTAISTQNGTALQFKKQSGATITNIFLSGYATNVDMKDGGALSNVQIDGADATTTNPYNTGTQVDISAWTWRSAGL